jgi:hypothetical protein
VRCRARAALAALLLAGCATGGGPAPRVAPARDHAAALRAFTVMDLEAAVKLAVAGQDDAALMCYQFVLEEVRKAQAATRAAVGSDTPGPVSVIQKFRNGLHGPAESTSRTFFGRLDLHCASYRTSVEIDLLRGAMMGAAVAGGDVAALLPALKALAPVLGLTLPP